MESSQAIRRGTEVGLLMKFPWEAEGHGFNRALSGLESNAANSPSWVRDHS